DYEFHVSDSSAYEASGGDNIWKDSEVKCEGEISTTLMLSLAELSRKEIIGIHDLQEHLPEISQTTLKNINISWPEKYGITMDSFQVTEIILPEADAATLYQAQRAAELSADPAAMNDAMLKAQRAAQLSADPAAMNAAMAAAMMQAQRAVQPSSNPAVLNNAMAGQGAGQQNGWICPNCSHQNMGKFCTECGTPRP
ncbi:MAG: hypothetical protein K5989_06445, partial [Lachnospiraceae bacterium]|nr:hypothetical protein [Lachnospiraceae bacterium]